MSALPVREHAHRFPRSHYVGRKSVSFTACTLHRRPLIANPVVFEALVALLAKAAAENACGVPIFTFMPDHLHALLLGTTETSDAKAAIDRFKALSGGWFYRHCPDVHWQKDYWDHVVREAEGWEAQACYIAANPCRAGLVETPLDWPYTGSIGYDLEAILQDAFWR